MGVQMKTQDLQINQFMLKNLSMGFFDRILGVWCAPILVGSILVAFIIFSFNPALSQEKKGDPSFVAVGAGSFDFNRKKDDGLELRIEYRSGQKFMDTIFKPFGAVGYSPNDHIFFGGGLLVDMFFGRRYVLTPSFGPHIYSGGNNKLDLGHQLQFRSQLEFSYRLDDRARLGVAVSHYSNAGLGSKNPGTESLIVYYNHPLKLK
jgi:lipid A 3-O-deacylase